MKNNNWKDFAPWFLTIACCFTLFFIGVFLVKNINWYKESVFNDQIKEINNPEYRFYAYHLHLSMIKRSIGLFSGFSIMFLGLGVAFYTLKDNITIGTESVGFSTKIATASPGIIALIVGAYLIVATISSKDHFPGYQDSQNQNYQYFNAPLDESKKPVIP